MKVAVLLDLADDQARRFLELGLAVRWPPEPSAVAVTIGAPSPDVVELAAPLNPALFVAALRRRFPALLKGSKADPAERRSNARAFAALLDNADTVHALGGDPMKPRAPSAVLAEVAGVSEQWARKLLREAKTTPASALGQMRQVLTGTETVSLACTPIRGRTASRVFRG